MNRKMMLFVVVVFCFVVAGNAAHAISYFNFYEFNRTWYDANKTADPEDDLLCWAAVASNMLRYSGWTHGLPYASEDDIFDYFIDHWTNEAGSPYYGVDWWLDGTNDKQGEAGWAQVDVPGGGFFPTFSFDDYYSFSSDDATALDTIADYLRQNLAVGLWLGGGGAHLVTAWGYDYDASGNYLGVWLADSDDYSGYKTVSYYDILYNAATNQWFLQNYNGSNAWYIGEVHGLASIPEPTTMLLFGTGLAGLAAVGRRRK